MKYVTYSINILKVSSCTSALTYVNNAMQDSCRPGVKDAVQLCQNAGIKVFFFCAKFLVACNVENLFLLLIMWFILKMRIIEFVWDNSPLPPIFLSLSLSHTHTLHTIMINIREREREINFVKVLQFIKRTILYS